MSTKVKGDKIKEGSIPLSALCSGNNLLKGFIGDSSDSIRLEEDNKNYYPTGPSNIQTVYVKISQLESLFELQKYNTLRLAAGPISEIIWDDNGIRITKLASYYTPIIYSKVKAPTPDWNALEGEAGYIENKPDIDPVVWKYMCNPLNIMEADTIPQDLHNLIYNSKTDTLNPIIINLMMLDDCTIGDIDSTQPWCYINTRYNSNDPYIYFPDKRQFIIKSNMQD